MSLNFDSYGRIPDEPSYDGSQLGSMELYNLKIQKVIANFTEFDAVTKAYVDKKMDDLVNGASTTLDTLKEIESYLTDSNIAGSVAKELSDLSSAISNEATRASGVESTLSGRIGALESNTASGASLSTLQGEVDATQTGAGLNNNGQYVADAGRFYIGEAASLKAADAILDNALNSEANIRSSADNALSERVDALESDPTTQAAVDSVVSNIQIENERATDAEGLLGSRIDDLTTSNVSEGTNQYYTEAKVKAAVVHEYANWDPNNRVRDPKYDMSTSYAFDLLSSELDDIHGREDASAESIEELTNRPFSSVGGFSVQHNTEDETVNGTGKYMYFSERWRLYGKSDGSRLIFEYNSGSQETPNWKSAVPFISSV